MAGWKHGKIFLTCKKLPDDQANRHAMEMSNADDAIAGEVQGDHGDG